jgi:hypothetical protein
MAYQNCAGQTVTFPIENRMFGLNSLAKHLNELVRAGQIHGWHPERWTDWHHTAIQISFDSVEDATFASQLSVETRDKLPAAVASETIVESS